MITLALAAALACASVTVVDGDSFRCDGERIRIANIDAPELRARCEAERIGAHLARRRLGEMLQGELVILPDRRDRYGRVLARVFADGMDVGERMVAEGYAREWRGKREGWC